MLRPQSPSPPAPPRCPSFPAPCRHSLRLPPGSSRPAFRTQLKGHLLQEALFSLTATPKGALGTQGPKGHGLRWPAVTPGALLPEKSMIHAGGGMGLGAFTAEDRLSASRMPEELSEGKCSTSQTARVHVGRPRWGLVPGQTLRQEV